MKNLNKLLYKELNLINDKINSLFNINNDVDIELHKFLMSPNKRIRSSLTILYLKALGIEKLKKETYDILIAGELIHNASLLHDDVIDDAKIRRKCTTIGNLFSPKISILLGDLLVSYAVEKLLYTDQNIIKNFQNCIKKMSSAEISQFLSRGKLIDEKEYINICKGKTSALFVTIMKSAFYNEKINFYKIENFANNFGILFQLKNDLEEESEFNDHKNQIYTLKNIIGIEKTNILIDNYLSKLRREILDLKDSVYKKALEELLECL